MLKLYAFIVSFFLIGIIFLRLPEESAGLTSFATKSNFLGSPRSAQMFLNILTMIGILFYIGIALQLNLLNN